MRDRAQNIK